MAQEPPRHTFLFADLAGFTALTEAMGDRDAAELAGEFCYAVRELLPEHRAQEVKAIGDALMIRGDQASEAIQLGLRVVHEVGGKHFFPTVRVGMHTGPAVERNGDWFGATVNVAARVSGIAAGGEVLVTEATREAAGDVREVDFHERGRRALRKSRSRSCSTQPLAAGGLGVLAADRSGLPDGRRSRPCRRRDYSPRDRVLLLLVGLRGALRGGARQVCSDQRSWVAIHPAALARSGEGLLALLVFLHRELPLGKAPIEDHKRVAAAA